MGAKDVEQVLLNGGRLFINPTDDPLNRANEPGLGTELGVVADAFVEPRVRTSRSVAADDDLAGATVGVYYHGEAMVLGVSLLQTDDDVKQLVFRNTKTVAGGEVAFAYGTTLPGAAVPGNKLVFMANDPNHESLVIYDARVAFQVTAELAMSAIDELVYAVVFEAVPDGTAVYERGRLEDLVVSP